MDNDIKKNDLENTLFCQQCKIYMCKKCEKLYSDIFPNHPHCKLKKGEEIFTGLCKEKNHPYELKYFLKLITHYVVLNGLLNLKGKIMVSILIVMYAQLKILKMKKKMV